MALLRENIRDQRKYYTIAVLAMVVVAAMTSSVAWIMRYIVDAMTIPDNKGMVMMVALGVVAIFTFKGLATYVQVVALTRAGKPNRRHPADQALRQAAPARRVLFQPHRVLRPADAGHAVGAGRAGDHRHHRVTSFVRDLLTLIGLLAVMFYQQPILSAVSMIIGPAAIFGIRVLLRRCARSWSRRWPRLPRSSR